MDVKEKSVFELLFISIFSFVLIPFSAVIRGWCLTVLWLWALVPIGVPEINIVTACMLSILYAFLNIHNGNLKNKANTMLKEKDTFYIVSYVFGNAILQGPMIVGLAWIIKAILTPLFC